MNWALKTASHSASVDPQRRQLRSPASTSDVVLRTTTHFGRRTFSVCGRDVWNSLPVNTRLRLTCFFPTCCKDPSSHIAFIFSLISGPSCTISSTNVPLRILKTSPHSASVDPSVVNYGHQQPRPPLSVSVRSTSFFCQRTRHLE